MRDAVVLGLGVERWDFTKGIIERFRAVEALAEVERGQGQLARAPQTMHQPVSGTERPTKISHPATGSVALPL